VVTCSLTDETTMQISPTALPGVVVIEPKAFGDARGFFMETWNARRYAEAGLPGAFVQDNLSRSARGVLRGLHFQNPHAQGKLAYVLEGEVFDVAVDIRADSPTRGRWVGATLSAENRRQIWIPPGFAHGFCVLSEHALFAYKCTDYYCADCDGSVLWNDPDLGIEWPIEAPVLSAKDAAAPRLREIPLERLPRG
jgi:dTDP-4-dehydrorhamnose 3,5-epimerase